MTAAGGTVIMASRSIAKGKAAKSEIIKVSPAAKVDVMQLDLASFASIRHFVSEFKKKYSHLDVLINNAGIMALPEREETADGLEAQIGTNHFGHFLLTALLYPSLAKNGRIINHSSTAHAMVGAGFPTTDLLSEKNYGAWTAYGNSKIANLLFTYELNKRLKASGNPKNIISVAVHPGYSATGLQAGRFPFAEYANAYFAMDAKDGALPQNFAATEANVEPSVNTYYGPRFFAFGAPSLTKTDKRSWDAESQRVLWEESVRITGASFDF